MQRNSPAFTCKIDVVEGEQAFAALRAVAEADVGQSDFGHFGQDSTERADAEARTR